MQESKTKNQIIIDHLTLEHLSTFIIEICSISYKFAPMHVDAYFRLWEEKTFSWILDNEVVDLWRYKTLKQLHGPNLFPVVMSSVRGDGLTQPPSIRRSAGRPRTRRLRRRVQRDGMLILPGTDDLGVSDNEGSPKGPIELDQFNGVRDYGNQPQIFHGDRGTDNNFVKVP